MEATVIFKQDVGIYGGSITDLEGNTLIPFTEVRVVNEMVEAKFNLNTVEGAKVVTINFFFAGDSLHGQGEVTIGEKTTVLAYDLKRLPQIDLDYNKIVTEREPARKKLLIDEFGEKYPDSRLAAYAYQEAALMGRQQDNLEMMSEYGEKSLAIWPENFVLMTELGYAYIRGNMLNKAEANALRALELVREAAKPAQVTEEKWEQGKQSAMATNFSTLGFVHLSRSQDNQIPTTKRREAQQAIGPFKKAIEYNSGDDLSYFGLGFSYAILSHYPNAESCLAKAVALDGVVAERARRLLEDLYKSQHNDTIEGLEEVIARARSELELP